jgi:hypothetical protein
MWSAAFPVKNGLSARPSPSRIDAEDLAAGEGGHRLRAEAPIITCRVRNRSGREASRIGEIVVAAVTGRKAEEAAVEERTSPPECVAATRKAFRRRVRMSRVRIGDPPPYESNEVRSGAGAERFHLVVDAIAVRVDEDRGGRCNCWSPSADPSRRSAGPDRRCPAPPVEIDDRSRAPSPVADCPSGESRLLVTSIKTASLAKRSEVAWVNVPTDLRDRPGLRFCATQAGVRGAVVIQGRRSLNSSFASSTIPVSIQQSI